MAMESIEFLPQATEGDYVLSGVLTFATASRALRAAAPLFGAGAKALRFDLSGVDRADSAGVGLLIEWLRGARAAGCQLRYAHIPETLRAMIRVGGIEGMLPIDEPAGPPYKYNLKHEMT
jgi:phospholipid transport system transporter-binding protein